MADTADTIGSIGSILADIEKARAQGRVTEAGVNQEQAKAASDIFRTRMQAALQGPALSAQQTAQGDTMANIKPFAWTGATQQVGNIPVPQSTGGLTPANFGPATRQAGADLAQVAGARVKSPSFALPAAPVLAPLPNEGALDKLLKAAGAAGSLGGAGGDIGKLLKALADKIRGGSGGSVQGDKPSAGGALTGPSFGRDFTGWADPEDPEGRDPKLWDPDLPEADVTTDQFLDQWPENYGNTGDPVDPAQLPGQQVDVMDEYWNWVNKGGGGSGNGDDFEDWR